MTTRKHMYYGRIIRYPTQSLRKLCSPWYTTLMSWS